MSSPHQDSSCCIRTLDDMQITIYNSICLFSAVLSSLASLCKLYKDGYVAFFVSTRQRDYIIGWLFLTDLLACLGVIVRSLLWISGTMGAVGNQPTYPEVCIFIDVYISLLYMATFFWTFCYALECFLHENQNNPLSFRTYHAIVWIPSIICVTIGNAIVDAESGLACQATEQQLRNRYLSNFIPMAFVLLANPIIYFFTCRAITQTHKGRGTWTGNEQAIVNTQLKEQVKLTVIYTICWVPSIIHGIMQFTHNSPEGGNLFALWLVQALLNPLQGFFNSFVYNVPPSLKAPHKVLKPNSMSDEKSLLIRSIK